MNNMTTRILTVSTLKMFVRNKQSLFFTLFMPFIFIGIFGLIGFDKPQVIDVGVVAQAPSAMTQTFIDALGKISVFKIHRGTAATEKAALQKGDRDAVFILPNDLMPNPTTTSAPVTQTVTVLQNIARAQQAQTAIYF